MSDQELPPATRGKRGAKPSGKPTLKTIAQMTGLAVTTISRALNNAPELAQETRDRVQKIAAEIGYLPDRAALRLKTGRTNVITLILEPDEQIYGFGTNLVTGITEALRDTAYHLVITPLFLFGGAFFPLSQLPLVIRWIGYATPLWHGVELCRSLVSGTSVSGLAALGHVAYMTAFVVIGTVLMRTRMQRRLFS